VVAVWELDGGPKRRFDAPVFARGSGLLRPDAATLRHTPASGRLMPRVVGMHCRRPIRATMDRWAAKATGQNCLGEPFPTTFLHFVGCKEMNSVLRNSLQLSNSEATKRFGIVTGTYT
jgi:hypothetical protein